MAIFATINGLFFFIYFNVQSEWKFNVIGFEYVCEVLGCVWLLMNINISDFADKKIKRK